MIRPEDIFKIGHLCKPHGVEGEISFSFTSDIFDRTESPYWVLVMDGIPVPFFVESYRFRSETTALVKFLDIDTVEQAKWISEHDVFYPKEYAAAGEMEEGNLSWEYFKGFDVWIDRQGILLGTVTAVDETTLNVLFEILLPDTFPNRKEDSPTLIIPASEDFIVRCDHEERKLYMNLPDGLIDLSSAEFCG